MDNINEGPVCDHGTSRRELMFIRRIMDFQIQTRHSLFAVLLTLCITFGKYFGTLVLRLVGLAEPANVQTDQLAMLEAMTRGTCTNNYIGTNNGSFHVH